MPTIIIHPVTRVVGHLRIEFTVPNGGGSVSNPKCSGTMFRGIENILMWRNPRDATILTQRICGVCSTAHAMASSLALENAFNVTPPENSRIIRNLVLGAEFIMSHILHFYHFAVLDYINTTGILDMSPWDGGYITPDMITGSTAQTLVNNYITAFDMRRRAHEMGAIFAGKLPHPAIFIPGGCTAVVIPDRIDAFYNLLDELRDFIDNTYIPDVLNVADAFDGDPITEPDYWAIGKGCRKYLSYGVFDLDGGGYMLFPSGYLDATSNDRSAWSVDDFNQGNIMEYVKYSFYKDYDTPGTHPSQGITYAQYNKSNAYSWLKAPRYLPDGSTATVCEVGPLARMLIAYVGGTLSSEISNLINVATGGDPLKLCSVLGRLAARAIECKYIADSMDSWLHELIQADPVYTHQNIPKMASGFGLTEAPRGALGHWVSINSKKIRSYQCIAPTTWNASPMDYNDQNGPIEQAIIGTNVSDVSKPIEVLRVVHSFDCCLSCAAH